MCSQESSAEGCEHIPGAATGAFTEGADELDQKLPHPTPGPPFDLDNFPFTFEHVHDASRSIRIEADVRNPCDDNNQLLPYYAC